jgi:hypothetical protein
LWTLLSHRRADATRQQHAGAQGAQACNPAAPWNRIGHLNQ